MPQFNKRPPSDTPFGSVAQSPLLDGSLMSTNTSDSFIDNHPIELPPSARRATTLDVPGLTKSKVSPDGTISDRDVGSKLVIVMVGLPARGKSYITKKLARYLNWQQHETKIFNVGNTRRQANANAGPATHPLPDTSADSSPTIAPTQDSTFFSPSNQANARIREEWAMQTLDKLLDFILIEGGSIGILDATNTTIRRRRRVMERVKERSNNQLKILFVENICNDPELLEQNFRLKLSGPDYRDQDPETALKDFRLRVKNYEKVYEPIGEAEENIEGFQFIKMIDVGKKVVAYNIQGFLAAQTVFFLLNFNLQPRQIWITRHGESEDNISGHIGGDAPLTERGRKYAKALAKFIDHQREVFRRQQLEEYNKRIQSGRYAPKESPAGSGTSSPYSELDELPFCVWTSMLKRSVQSAAYFDEDRYDIKEMRMLDELYAGSFDHMTYDEIREKYPEEYEARKKNKLAYRYPGIGGESYLDVINRLRPIIVELERMHDHVLLITHRVVSRVLLAYFMNLNRSNIGDLDVPLHTLYMLEPKPYGVECAVYEYDENSDWFHKISSAPEQNQNGL
ncbi:hypothetical protein CANCADRAFT_31162 [Tortispora caseinolytica NRRL Y-17796]|uniref:6-phosphofructo-2-kinase domain-containing protein n=1 Tax=Tortispora caseinolytica NRRL Y-17796 TaxID=767744 RepID=A0A1E4TEA9_9ASCO|nr:hypothetical protein CANCADRAFT_31162 [Tortispora caseinolytica NRRL Y-17796]